MKAMQLSPRLTSYYYHWRNNLGCGLYHQQFQLSHLNTWSRPIAGIQMSSCWDMETKSRRQPILHLTIWIFLLPAVRHQIRSRQRIDFHWNQCPLQYSARSQMHRNCWVYKCHLLVIEAIASMRRIESRCRLVCHHLDWFQWYAKDCRLRFVKNERAGINC